MSKRITVTIEDGLYERLESSAEEGMRPLAVEAVYRMRLGLDRVYDRASLHSGDRVAVRDGVARIPKDLYKEFTDMSGGEVIPVDKSVPIEPLYTELVEFIGRVNGEGYQSTEEDLRELRSLEKRYGVKYNKYKGILEKVVDGKYLVVHRF